MTIFDLLFIALVLVSAGTLLFAAASAIFGQRPRAFRVLRRYAICAAIYLGIVMLVSLGSPRRVLKQGEQLCFDDWCISVEDTQRTVSASDISCVVRLRVFSEARRVTQRENGVLVYLTDVRGRRFDPLPDATAVPLNVSLRPAESVLTARTFKLPPETTVAGLVIAHQGGFPIDWLIIGGGPFRQPPIVRLDQ